MKLIDIFEDMRPVATVWKKRGNTIERGRVSKFFVDAKPLKKIEVERGKEEDSKETEELDRVRANREPGVSP